MTHYDVTRFCGGKLKIPARSLEFGIVPKPTSPFILLQPSVDEPLEFDVEVLDGEVVGGEQLGTCDELHSRDLLSGREE